VHVRLSGVRLTESELLEGAVVRLGVEEVDGEELKGDPAAVDGEVLPVDGLERNRVDVGREETTALAENLFDTDTHGTLSVGENFDEESVSERVVANVVARRVGEVEEQRRNGSRVVSVALKLGNTKRVERYRHANEDDQHATGRKHKHPPAPEASDNKSNDNTVEQTPALVSNVDASLSEVGGVTHHLEEQVGVVREEGVAAHLREETHHNGDEHTTTHTGGGEHVHPGLLRVLELELDGRSDLGHLGLDKDRGSIAFSVVLGENSECLVIAVLADEPTGALGDHASHLSVQNLISGTADHLQDGSNLEKGWANLQQGRQAPAPISLDLNSLDGNGGSNDSSHKVRGIEEGSEVSTLLGVAELSDQSGSRDNAEDDTDTEQHTCNDVHGHCERLNFEA